jgi:hypothetical protein
MQEMGFKYDPSTAGSSVRFDPPNPKDPVRWTFRAIYFSADWIRLSLSPSTDVRRPSSSYERCLTGLPTAHPDSTIHPIMLKEFSKRLRNQYGWHESDFLKKSR